MKLIIIGGVAGGASAATRARRLNEEAEILMVDRGKYVSFANCGLPYFIEGSIKERDKLIVNTPESIKRRYNIDVKTETEAVRIDRDEKSVVLKDLVTGEEYRERYDKLILSPGAEPIIPPLPGIDNENVFTLRTIPDMDRIKRRVDSSDSKSAVIVGAGYIGLEMAEALKERGLKVSLVEKNEQVFGVADREIANVIEQHLRLNGVQLYLEAGMESIEKSEAGTVVHLENGERIEADLVIMAIGVRPETSLAVEAGVKTGKRNGITVNERMQTSDADIYAVGDAIEVTDYIGEFKTIVPLAGPANRQGRIAADNIMGRDSIYRDTQGTGIVKVFDLSVGMTGLNERAIQKQGYKYEKIHIHPSSHASYYPGSAQMQLKVMFEKPSGKILGAQAVGSRGVDKRIDVIATALRGGMTVFDLEHLELSYAPPFGSAKDPVNFAGFVAANILKGDVRPMYPEEVDDIGDGQFVLDVRTPAEFETGAIENAKNIPIDELRGRLGELPRDKEAVVYCAVGLRGYNACRILSQEGFKCRNLSGGIKTYKNYKGESKAAKPGAKGTGPAFKKDKTGVDIVTEVDARGLACPGPIMRLKNELDKVKEGQAVKIFTTDAGFVNDVDGWCESTGNSLAEFNKDKDIFEAVIVKGQKVSNASTNRGEGKTAVVFSNDFDKAMAAFIIANGAASMGKEVTLFFTFWGLNLLRKDEKVKVNKNAVEKMFGWMMPRGAERAKLSRMNMGGMGLKMIKRIMKKKNVSSLTELIEKARDNGVRLVACSMSMDLMGIKKEELIDGVEEGGVGMYLSRAEGADVNLFI